MSSTRTRRDSIISHRRTLSSPLINVSNLHDGDMSKTTLSSLPSTATRPTFLISSEHKSKHVLFPISLSAISPAFASAVRRYRVRPSMIALLALLALAAFAVLHQHLNESPSLQFSSTAASAPAARHVANTRPRHRTARPPRPPKINLAPEEELAVVIAFMAALPSNALPDSVNPTLPVDPDLVLDFDTRSSKAPREVRQLVEDTWSRLPVVLLSKRYSPIGREIKNIIAEYNLKPSITVFDIDERADEAVMIPTLYRLTKFSDLPILLLGGQPIGSIETIRELHKSGELRSMVAASGAIIDGAKKKKKGRRSVPHP